MADEEKKKRRRNRKTRQEWNPHWLLKIAYAAVSLVFFFF